MADAAPSTRAESPAHRELKRLALLWAQAQGYRAAACEVSMPDRGVRLDVAAYRPARIRKEQWSDHHKRTRAISCPAVGVTAIFECKAFKPDFRKDSRSVAATLEKLAALALKKARIEDELRLYYPSIRNGDSLFQEYETLNFERPGYERYQQVIAEIRLLSARLHGNTKFDRLAKTAAANLYYVVAEPDILKTHELPANWGLLLRTADTLELAQKPIWHDIAEPARLDLLHRISIAATRAVHREAGVPPIWPSQK